MHSVLDPNSWIFDGKDWVVTIIKRSKCNTGRSREGPQRRARRLHMLFLLLFYVNEQHNHKIDTARSFSTTTKTDSSSPSISLSLELAVDVSSIFSLIIEFSAKNFLHYIFLQFLFLSSWIYQWWILSHFSLFSGRLLLRQPKRWIKIGVKCFSQPLLSIHSFIIHEIPRDLLFFQNIHQKVRTPKLNASLSFYSFFAGASIREMKNMQIFI